MKLELSQDERVRVIGSSAKGCNHIDITGIEYGSALKAELYPWAQYIEIRKKGNEMALFLFANKGAKKYHDFGWWADAEVVFALNEVYKEKAS